VKLQNKLFYVNRVFSLVVIGFIYASTAFSAVPQIINYQGSLSDSGGTPVNATLNITFTLYDVVSGPGTTLWQETQSVDVTNGVFNVQLGADAGNPLTSSILNDPLYLGVQVDTDAEMTPRQRISSAAFAIRSQTVENDTLNSLSCGNGEVPKWNGGAWACAVDDNSGGDITGVSTSKGIVGGGNSGNVNISADTNFLQTRVNGTCPAGQSIRAIDANGAVTCEVDTDTNTNAFTICASGFFLNGDGSCDPVPPTYSAGSGLQLIGTTFLIPTNGVNSSHLVANSVGASEIATNAVGAAEIAPNAVGTGELVNGTVNVVDLHDSAKGVGINGAILIPASKFQTTSHTTSFSMQFAGYIRPSSINQTMCLVAPVDLPHGVTITHFDISALDNSATRNFNFSLERVSFSSGGKAFLATAETTGASGLVRIFTDSTIVNPTVNGLSYIYQISGCIQSDAVTTINTRLYAARIRYN